MVRRATVQIEAEGSATLNPKLCAADHGADDFALLRASAGVDQCSKRDVCLLMRQLDSEFERRGKAGELDGAGEVNRRYLKTGKCTGMHHGLKLEAVSEAACEAEASAKGITYGTVNSPERPAGCYQVSWNNGKTKRIRYNTAVSTLTETCPKPKKGEAQEYGCAGVVYRSSSKKAWAVQTRYEYSLVCDEVKRTDDPYWSPYKLKEEMFGRAKYNTACSFGKMADLYRDGLTKSPCAEILSFKQGKYQQASDAVAAGDETYARALMEKNVLIDVIANDWCGSTWDEARANEDVCTVEHPNANYGTKVAMTADACAGIEDELFADRIADLDPMDPPDFFQHAQVQR